MSNSPQDERANGALPLDMHAYALVMTAVANGDIACKIPVESADGTALQGEARELALTINAMVDQLTVFAAEVTRLSREIGTQGKLGGQAEVQGMTGAWDGLITDINGMSANVTDNVRVITHAARASLQGDTSSRIEAPMQGEWLLLRDAVNALMERAIDAKPM
jgi:HAMP domain-containing protein